MTSILIKNATQVVSPQPQLLRGSKLGELSIQTDTSLYLHKGKIQAIGPLTELQQYSLEETQIIDASRNVVIPGFVDSHSHLVFGGSRADEFAARCQGKSYEEIAAAGGGIANTVRAIHQLSQVELKAQAHQHLKRALHQGITTMEIKSGYGLTQETEIKILQIIEELKQEQPIELISTFLGAHSIPQGKKKEDYLQEIMAMLPEAAKYARFCDVFCEKGYFSAKEAKMILAAAKEVGLLPKMHVNQFHDIGGIPVGIESDVVSVDHLEVISERDIDLLAHSDVVCTFLPGVSLFLNIPYSPARKMIQAGCIPALATDFNPGSSMTLSMQLLLNLACTQMGFSVEEALCSATQNGAYALRKSNVGCILPGWQADLLILNTDNYKNLAYFFGENHIAKVIKKGEIACEREIL